MSRKSEFSEGDDPITIVRKRTKDDVPDGAAGWVKIDTYPALDERIRAVDVYQTKPPYVLRYRIVTKSSYDNSYAWPAVVAIRNELHIRFGVTTAIEFGIIPKDSNRVVEWRSLGEFPTFRENHVHKPGNPEYVVMSRDWVPVVRFKQKG